MGNVQLLKNMKKYLEEKRKLAKENPEEAKKQSFETLRKMGLVK